MDREPLHVSGVAHSNARSTGEWFVSHWFAMFVMIYGMWIWLPWLAPVMMQIGQSELGKAIYFVYSFFCHQLPERSFFLFGRQSMYSLAEVQAAWQNSLNPMVLRTFIGTEVMGWKVAWSDRMVSFYTSIWLMSLAWWPLRCKVRPLSWWGFVLLLLPLVLDGGTHALSDLAGIGRGFRDSNAWLSSLTNNSLPFSYAGDSFGSLNSWARLITGLLAGTGIAWFAFPHMESALAPDRR